MNVQQFAVKKPRKKVAKKAKKKAKKLTKSQAMRRRHEISILKKLGFSKVNFNPSTGEKELGLYQAPEGKCKQTVVKV